MMTSNSDTTLQHSILCEGPIDNKRKRRSSIFRPEATGIVWCAAELPSFRCQNNVNEFPPSYIDKLTQENSKWKEIYTGILTEMFDLQKRAKQSAVDVTFTNLDDYEYYLRKAEDLSYQMNNIIEIHDNVATMRSIKQKELLRLLKFIHHQTRQHLNV